MLTLTREQMINTVELSYFSNIDHKNIDVVLDCFASDATFTIQSAFTSYVGRDSQIKTFYETIIRTFQTIWHGDFEHIVDVDQQRISTQFNVRRIDMKNIKSSMSNCNVFRFQNGKFQNVFVYASGGSHLIPDE